MAERWSAHQSAITELFLVKRFTLDKVVEEMKRRGFVASKAQYERRLKAWGCRKHRKESDWTSIGRIVQRRKRVGKSSIVIAHGKRLPDQKTRKEISRHYFPTIEEQYGQAPSPRTPDGMYICTPPQTSSKTYLLQNLPWFGCFIYLGCRGVCDLDLPSAAHTLFLAANASLSLTTALQLQPASIISGQMVSALGKWTLSLTSETTTRSIHSRLQELIPERTYTETPTGLGHSLMPFQIDISAPFFSLILYLSSNGLLDDDVEAEILEIFRNKTDLSLLQFFFSIKEPTVEAFAEKLFIKAVDAEDYGITEVLLKTGVTPNTTSPRFYGSPLVYCAQKGNLELVRLLLDHGAEVNIPAEDYFYGLTALEAAAKGGHIELIQLLLEYGANINASVTYEYGRTALQAAAEAGSFKAVQFLLNNGADVNAPPAEISGMTALQAASEKGAIEIILLLLEYGADINAPPADDEGVTALQVAAEGGDMEVVQLLLDCGADVNAPAGDGDFGKTALQAAAGKGCTDIIHLLLGCGANVNAPAGDVAGNTALQAAAHSGLMEPTQLLLEYGADVNAPPAKRHGKTALQVAAVRNYVELVQLLLEHGADVNAPAAEYGETALQAAAKAGHTKVVQLLLKHGADVNGLPAEDYGCSALQATVLKGHIELTHLLLDWGADIKAPATGDFGRTAIQGAATTGNIELVRLLIDAGADVNAQPSYSNGVTAIQAASIHGYIGIVHLLLEHDADVNAPGATVNGRTALEGAAEHGRLDILQVLLNAGAERNIQGHDQYQRAVELASKEGHHAVARFLKSKVFIE